MRSDLRRDHASPELLSRISRELGSDYPLQGHAALRMWGQTGDRPTRWIAAADPVYLEPQLDRLCLHALQRDRVSASELRGLIDHLQATLGKDKRIGFTRLGAHGYATAASAFATAAVPAYVVDRQDPREFLPTGDGAATQRNVIGEIEMALHEHAINAERAAANLKPVNSLWLWGGGAAPEARPRQLPPLFSNDPLLNGYWRSGMGEAARWPGDIRRCLQKSVGGFVADIPWDADDAEMLEQSLLSLREALRRRRLGRLVLLFRDGIRAEVLRSHARRVWRRNSLLLQSD